MARRHGGNLVGGLILVGLGLYFLLDNLGFRPPGLGQLWPIFPLAGGLVFIWSYLSGREKEPGVLIPGCGGFLVGIFFFAITLGPLRWDDLGNWWPIFPMIGGIAFFTLFALGKPREPGVLVPGLGGLLVGIFFFLITVGPLRWSDMGRLWPAFFVILGITFFGLWLAQRRDTGLLVTSVVFTLVGAVVLSFLFEIPGLGWLVDAWPAALILIGIVLVARSFVRRSGE